MLVSLALSIATALPGAPAPLSDPHLLQVEFPAAGGPGVGFDGQPVINRLSNLPLSADAQATFDTDFQSLGYFGAFALSKDGGYGYSSGVGSLAGARDIALAQCLSLNSNCMVVAELVPSDYVDPGPGAVTLSQQVYGHFRTAAKNPDFQALAVSEDGAFAMYWAMPSQAEANAQALADCDANRERSLPGLRQMPCVLVTNLP